MIKQIKQDFILTSVIVIFLLHFLFSYINGSSYSIAKILMIFLIQIYTIYLSIKKIDIRLTLNNTYTLIFFLYMLFQSYLSPYIVGFGQDHQIFINVYFILMLLLIIISTNANTNSFILKRLLYSVFVLHLIIVFVFIHGTISNETFEYISKIHFTNIRFLNHITTLSLPILFLFLFLAKNNFFKILISFLIIFSIFSLIITGARGSTISLSTSLIFIYIISKRNDRKYFIYIGSLLFLTIILWIIYTNYVGTSDLVMSDHLMSTNTSNRYLIYSTIVKNMFKFDYLIYALGFINPVITDLGFAFSHNLFLTIFMGAGSLGLILFIFLCFIFFKTSISYVIKKNNIINLMILWSVISFLIHTQVSNVFLSSLGIIVLILVLSVYIKKTFSSEVKYYIVPKYLILIFISFSLISFYYISIITVSMYKYSDIEIYMASIFAMPFPVHYY